MNTNREARTRKSELPYHTTFRLKAEATQT